MSKTENTRPIKVIETDPTVRRFTRSDGETVHLTGGIKRYSKPKRKQQQHVVRQHIRRYLTDALRLAHDPDLIDFPPSSAMYRSVGRRA